MIQRIQTLYMMLASLAVIGLYLWFPVITDQGGEVVLTREQPSMTGLMAVGLLLVVWSIFSFKVRKRQFVLNRLAIIVNFVLLGVFVYRTLTVSGETLVSEKERTRRHPRDQSQAGVRFLGRQGQEADAAR